MFSESNGEKQEIKIKSVDPQFKPVEVTIKPGENGEPGTVVEVEPTPSSQTDKKQG